jgi:uncharacterized protein YggT (Ycf19 family)
MLSILGVVLQVIEIVFLVFFVMQLVDPCGNHRVTVLLKPFVEPILKPIRALLPANQLDYTALVVVLALNVVRWVFGMR